MSKKISKAYFAKFKKAFIYWQKKFGLTQYDVSFYQSKDVQGFAEVATNDESMKASAVLPFKLDDLDTKLDDGPESHGKHEAIHLLLSRLTYLAKNRFTGIDEILEENESVVNRLMEAMK